MLLRRNADVVLVSLQPRRRSPRRPRYAQRSCLVAPIRRQDKGLVQVPVLAARRSCTPGLSGGVDNLVRSDGIRQFLDYKKFRCRKHAPGNVSSLRDCQPSPPAHKLTFTVFHQRQGRPRSPALLRSTRPQPALVAHFLRFQVSQARSRQHRRLDRYCRQVGP